MTAALTQARYSGVYTAGDTHIEWLPKTWRGGGTVRGIIASHGATGSDLDPLSFTTFPHWAPILQRLCGMGYPIISVNAGGSLFGNDTVISTYMPAALTRLAAMGAKTDKVALFGCSMGNLTGMNWARANPTKVACIAGVAPASDLNDIVTNNRDGQAANVNAAYGGAYSDATMGATHNPARYGATLAGIPTRLYYSDADPAIPPATVTALATLIGASATATDLGNLGSVHGDLTFAGMTSVQIDSLVTFIAANL